nr:MAG TPA: hypothetical protein [Caudoviricetes sp.]
MDREVLKTQIYGGENRLTKRRKGLSHGTQRFTR